MRLTKNYNNSMQKSSNNDNLYDPQRTLLLNYIIFLSTRIAHLEWSKFWIFNSKKNIPKMIAKHVLGEFDENGCLTKKPSMPLEQCRPRVRICHQSRNFADYVCGNDGYFNIVNLLTPQRRFPPPLNHFNWKIGTSY